MAVKQGTLELEDVMVSGELTWLTSRPIQHQAKG